MTFLIQTFLAAASDAEVIKLDHQLIRIGQLQSGIFILQLLVFGFQAWLLQRTVKAAGDQSKQMGRSIDEATRAANALETSAKAAAVASENVTVMTKRVAQQMRAYLSVRINTGAYQDRVANVPFGVNPMLINTGQTPAYKVRYIAKAAVLPFSLADDFSFPPLDEPRAIFGLLAPQQNMIMNAFVEGPFFNDLEAEEIKRGRGRRIYIWGRVIYEDVTGEQRYTNFAHNIFWLSLPGEPTYGNYVDRNNDAT
jgi:hypothetical protein